MVLFSLILVAAVASLYLAVANVPWSIGEHFNSSQTTLDLVAIGYSLGLVCSVLWLGALGDRFGRKLMLVAGTVPAIPPPRRARSGTKSVGGAESIAQQYPQ
jgi:DHA2 family multidrug resistance protein-like MFS transporter